MADRLPINATIWSQSLSALATAGYQAAAWRDFGVDMARDDAQHQHVERADGKRRAITAEDDGNHSERDQKNEGQYAMARYKGTEKTARQRDRGGNDDLAKAIAIGVKAYGDRGQECTDGDIDRGIGIAIQPAEKERQAGADGNPDRVRSRMIGRQLQERKLVYPCAFFSARHEVYPKPFSQLSAMRYRRLKLYGQGL
ncbi:hypothetical protein FF124_11020 [Martelella lutilitoris]|uniref:Uncharacterized protein n=1 Tax=Martelella lutilitoris TaxID=2583532 RepID=A0A5C4JSG1_9HYPH|nr:hypothetical protein [Martelella lutilitoris]TNB48101.1 hypothetical protein FF124_11020 [Martelella lutilitoris]